jgi:hypothetical protein
MTSQCGLEMFSVVLKDETKGPNTMYTMGTSMSSNMNV